MSPTRFQTSAHRDVDRGGNRCSAAATTTILDLCDQTSRQILSLGWDPIGVQLGTFSNGWLLRCGGTSKEPSHTAAIVSN